MKINYIKKRRKKEIRPSTLKKFKKLNEKMSSIVEYLW